MYVYAHSDVLGKEAAIAALDGKTPRSVPIPDCGLADKIGRCETKIDKFICPHPDGKEPCSQRSPQFPPDGISFIGLSNFKHVVRNIKVDQPLLSAARDRARQMCGPDPEMIKLQTSTSQSKVPIGKTSAWTFCTCRAWQRTHRDRLYPQ